MQLTTTRVAGAAGILLLLCASVGPFRACQLSPKGLNDDAYVTLCYAKNLAAGNGFVYNHGPPTLGTTTPLFTLAVAGLSRIVGTRDVARVAICLTSVLWVLLPWIVFGCRRAFGLAAWEAVIIGLFILAFGQPNIGAESIPFQVLLFFALAFFARESYVTAGFSVGLLTLCRGEGFLLLPIFLILLCVRGVHAGGWRPTSHRHAFAPSPWCAVNAIRRANPLLRLSLGAAVPLLVWAIYAQLAFGYVVPHTLGIKMQQGAGQPLHAQFPGGLLRDMRYWVALGMPRTVGITILQWALVMVGLCGVTLRARKFLPLVLWCIGYVGAYAALGVPEWYWWYRLPAYWCWTVLCALGLTHCVRLSCHALRRWIQCGDGVVGGMATLLVFGAVMHHGVTAVDPVPDERSDVYLQVCSWMNTHADPGASLAAAEVGYLGYYTSNRIVDIAGLVMPKGSSVGGSLGWEEALAHYTPDYFVRGAKRPDGCPPRIPMGGVEYTRVRFFTSPRTEDYVLYGRADNAEASASDRPGGEAKGSYPAPRSRGATKG